MENNKNKKYLVIVIILISVSFIGINLLKSKPKEEKEKTINKEETRSMLSYTLDGEKTDIKPTKESGYIANKIICENGSNLIWDNTNWEVEIISLASNDVCSVDFTTNALTEGYRITATTNVEGSIDSLSKATIKNGTIIFYPNKGQEITEVSGCSGVVENNKVIVNNVTSNQTCNIKVQLKTLFATLSDGIKYTVGTRTDFSTPVGGTKIQNGYNSTRQIYLAEDNYYFAGNPSDNWVLFAGFWWRIIRTNETEGTRLLYAGTSHDTRNGYITSSIVWYDSIEDYRYVQWSYASNTIGKTLTSWYDANITGDNINFINTDVEYCNDTIQASYSGKDRHFGAYGRLYTNKNPSYSCGINSNTTHKKIGLMTADELAYAGGVYGQNAPNTYYYRNSRNNGLCKDERSDECSITYDYVWWTMSPYGYINGYPLLVNVVGSTAPGKMLDGGTHGKYALRPVITLKPEILVTGSGTTDDPFIPSL